MKQKRIRLMICILLLACTLLFFYRYDTSKVTYVKGFPTKDSPALSEFLRGSRYNFLYDVNGVDVYIKRNRNEDYKEVSFHYNKEDELKTFYEPLFYTKDVEKTYYNLWENDELTDKIEQQIANKDEFNLPTLKLEGKKHLYVNKTERNNIRFTGDVIVGDVRNDGKKYYIILGNGKGKSNE